MALNSEGTSLMSDTLEGTDYMNCEITSTLEKEPEHQASTIESRSELNQLTLNVLRIESQTDYLVPPRSVLVSEDLLGYQLKNILEETFVTNLNECELVFTHEYSDQFTPTATLAEDLTLSSQGFIQGTTLLIKSRPVNFEFVNMGFVDDDERLTTRTSSTGKISTEKLGCLTLALAMNSRRITQKLHTSLLSELTGRKSAPKLKLHPRKRRLCSV